jgi:hypothetical protein
VKLVVLSTGMTGLTFELKADKTTIGRVEDNSIQIPDPSVSSHHCEVLRRGGTVVVRDLNSTNGTYINGLPITESDIKPGQILRLGQIEMRLEADQPAAPTQKHFDRTSVIPGGVNRSDLDQAHDPGGFGRGTGFSKKTNTLNETFVIIAVILGVIIVALLIYVSTTIHR